MSLGERLQLCPMLRVTIMLILGIIVGKAVCPFIPIIAWVVLAFVSLAVAFAVNKYPVGQSVAILLSFFFVGGLLVSFSIEKMKISLPKYPVTYQAVLVSEPVVHGKVIQADMMVVGDGKPIKVKASILRDTVDNRWQRLHVGDGITATSFLDEPHNFVQSTFDYAAWLKEHGFKAETFIYYSDWKKSVVDLTKLSYIDRTVIQARKFRQRLLARYHDLGADGQSYAVLAAMTLGDKSALSRELKDDYSIAGASHVLALSGLHLSIIYGVLTLLTIAFRRRWLPQLLIMTAIWSYVVLVGMSPSVVRSAVMLTVIAMVEILNRRAMLLNSLSLAAFVMLLWNPMSLYDVGFEMSFMAVLGIALFEPLLFRRHYTSSIALRIVYWFWGIVSVSIAAQIGTAPLVAYYFGRFSCYFILTNIIVIPCATAILYGTVLVAVLSIIPSVSSWLAGLLIGLVGLLNSSLHWIASLPCASIEGINWSVYQVIGVYMFIAAIYYAITFFVRDED